MRDALLIVREDGMVQVGAIPLGRIDDPLTDRLEAADYLRKRAGYRAAGPWHWQNRQPARRVRRVPQVMSLPTTLTAP